MVRLSAFATNVTCLARSGGREIVNCLLVRCISQHYLVMKSNATGYGPAPVKALNLLRCGCSAVNRTQTCLSLAAHDTLGSTANPLPPYIRVRTLAFQQGRLTDTCGSK